jgi:Cu+-exporting ATPase
MEWLAQNWIWLALGIGAVFMFSRGALGGHGGHGGCCGSGGHGGQKGAGPEDEIKDPVCGMTVDPKNAAAAAVREGTTYYFCSTSCRDKFEQVPEKYINAAAQGGNQHGGHHHG